jgi:hypothetical protein
MPFSAARTLGRNSAVVTTPTAPESARPCRSSSSLTRKISGVTTTPARHAAVYVMSTSGQLAISTTSRSPGRTPSRISPAANRDARSARAARVNHRPSKNSDSPSPCCSR